MKRLAIAAAGLALVLGLLAHDSALVQAQPVARIALPPPRGIVQLYSGCNNIVLTFADGTSTGKEPRVCRRPRFCNSETNDRR